MAEMMTPMSMLWACWVWILMVVASLMCPPPAVPAWNRVRERRSSQPIKTFPE